MSADLVAVEGDPLKDIDAVIKASDGHEGWCGCRRQEGIAAPY
jgi:hypothetical protein